MSQAGSDFNVGDVMGNLIFFTTYRIVKVLV